MRVTQLLGVDRGGEPAAVEQAVQVWGLSPDDGDALLRVGGIKLGVDGGFEGGFMREPYEEPYGEGGKFRGLQTVPQERYTAIVSVAQPPRLARLHARRRRCRDRPGARRVRSRQRGEVDRRAGAGASSTGSFRSRTSFRG